MRVRVSVLWFCINMKITACEQVATVCSFAGQQLRFKHRSDVLHSDMHFSLYLPPQAENVPVPVLYWLSGLTCNDENFVIKAGAQQFAAKTGMAIVTPDTSPRGESVPDDAKAAYDFGLGAGFYVNATQAPWSEHYQMYDYIMQELPDVLSTCTALDLSRMAIVGHSMGGHGALMCALRNPGKFTSVSAFAPIVAPAQCPWGRKAFSNYLGADESLWQQYDSVALAKNYSGSLSILIDQGDQDNFLQEQLKPELFQAACSQAGIDLTLRMQTGYDHSFYFIASFIEDHINYHAKALGL